MDLSRVVISLLASAAAFVLATARIAWAESPITGMDVFTFSESFTEPFLCGGEPYAVTANGHGVVHFTFFEETEALHFHEVVHGKAISVPLDGTGPTYTAKSS